MKNLVTILTTALLCCASYNSALAQTSSKVEMDSLPKNTHDLIHSKYAKYTVNRMLKKQEENGTISYEIELQRKTKVLTLTCNAEGELVNTEKSKEYSFDGTESPSGGGGGGGGGGGHSH